MQRNVIETILGAVVLLVAASFMITAYKGSDVKVESGYPVTAKFDNISGINIGSDVRIGGIKVGVISDLTLDDATYQAVATLSIRDQTKIPADSSAAIVSSGLLGDKFVQITPGADDAMVEADGALNFTQSSVSLEELIGKFVFSAGGVDGKEKSESTPEAAPANNAATELSPL